MHHEVKHPCVAHKMSRLRDERTGHKQFRELATEITQLICYEALQNVALESVDVQTPLAVAKCQQLAEDIVVVPILRAGVGMLDGILSLVQTARVGFVGLYRDEDTKQPVENYSKLPKTSTDALHIVIDPMLATGGSTAATIELLKANGAKRIIVVAIVTCPEGLAEVARDHDDVTVYAAAIDERLNNKKYIVPGHGDAGDRLFGTR